jgi:hypothetical protein
MMKERLAAIIIGGLMLLSVAGFALMGIGRFGDNGNQPLDVPNIMNEYLSGEQVSSILQSGRVLIRDVYTGTCSDCVTKRPTLEMFVNSFGGLIVLEEVMIDADNTTLVDENGYVKFEMISPTGDIIDLRDKELDQESLTDIFCEISAIQPKECLLRDMASSRPPIEPGNMTDITNETMNQTDVIDDLNKTQNDSSLNDTNSTDFNLSDNSSV